MCLRVGVGVVVFDEHICSAKVWTRLCVLKSSGINYLYPLYTYLFIKLHKCFIFVNTAGFC